MLLVGGGMLGWRERLDGALAMLRSDREWKVRLVVAEADGPEI